MAPSGEIFFPRASCSTEVPILKNVVHFSPFTYTKGWSYFPVETLAIYIAIIVKNPPRFKSWLVLIL